MATATKKSAPAKKAVRKAADTATRKTPEARAAAKTRRTASVTRGLMKADFSEDAVKAVFVSASSVSSEGAAPNPGGQPTPERSQPSHERTSRRTLS